MNDRMCAIAASGTVAGREPSPSRLGHSVTVNYRKEGKQMTRQCFGCSLLKSFRPRPDEQERYGFGDTGYGCREPGYEGYVNPQRPICVRGPFLKENHNGRG